MSRCRSWFVLPLLVACGGTTPPVTAGGGADRPAVARVVAGRSWTCVSDTQGNTECFGGGAHGQLSDVSAIACSWRECCLARQGEVFCWDASREWFPRNTRELEELPHLRVGESAIAIAPGAGFVACALAGAGRVLCRSEDGAELLSPRLRHPAVSIGGSSSHTCALESGGAVLCWGENRGHLGDGGRADAPYPVPALIPERVTDLAVSGHSCAIDVHGAVWCWGQNSFGQLGWGWASGQEAEATPQRAALEMSARAVATGAGFTCVLDADDDVYCWGANHSRQCGADEASVVVSPHRVLRLVDALGVTAGADHACAWAHDRVVCWGRGDGGALGDACTRSRCPPTTVTR